MSSDDYSNDDKIKKRERHWQFIIDQWVDIYYKEQMFKNSEDKDREKYTREHNIKKSKIWKEPKDEEK